MQKRLKLVHVITRLDRGGSAQNTVLNLLGLDVKRYDPVLVKGPGLESRMDRLETAQVESSLSRIRDRGITIKTCGSLIRKINPPVDFLCLVRLFWFFRSERPCIVHTHTSKAGFLGRLAAWWARVPVIVHTPHGHIFRGYYGPLATALFVAMERLAARVTHRIICLTASERRDYIRHRIAPSEKFVTIHSGVDLTGFRNTASPLETRKSLGIPKDHIVIGTVGRLVHVKGHEQLIRAFSILKDKHKDLRLILTGDGPLGDHLRRLCLELGIGEKVGFTGWRPDVPDLLSSFDIFAFPSLNEGMGRALVEAMAAGRPIVAADAGGISDLVKDGKNGLLVRPGDPEEMALALEQMLSNRKRMKQMGLNGKQMSGKFSGKRMTEKINSLYLSLCQRPELH